MFSQKNNGIFLFVFLMFAVKLCFAQQMCLKPYAGFDFGNIDTKFENNYGNHELAKDLVFFTPFAGIRLQEYLTLELGYQRSKNKKRTALLRPGEVNLGVTVLGPGVGSTFDTAMKIRGPQLTLAGRIPVNKDFFALLLGVGVTHAKADVEITKVSENAVASGRFAKFSSKKDVLRLLVGGEYMFSKHVGGRILFSQDHYSRLNLKASYGPGGGNGGNLEVKLKNMLKYSAGIFVSL